MASAPGRRRPGAPGSWRARARSARLCRPPARATIRLIAAMPMATPVVVSAVRSGRRPALPSPTFSVSRQCRRGGGINGLLLADRRLARVELDRAAVDHAHHAARAPRHLGVVRDQDDRRPAAVEVLAAASRMPSPAVESRLPVGSSARIRPGPVGQRARDRHLLLLTARQTARRACCDAPSRPTSASRWRARRRRSSSSTPASVSGRATLSSTVIDGIEVERLEDRADPLQPVVGEVAVGQLAERAGRRRRRGRRSAGRGRPSARAAWSCRSRTGRRPRRTRPGRSRARRSAARSTCISSPPPNSRETESSRRPTAWPRRSWKLVRALGRRSAPAAAAGAGSTAGEARSAQRRATGAASRLRDGGRRRPMRRPLRRCGPGAVRLRDRDGIVPAASRARLGAAAGALLGAA